jgi:hemerythrin
MEWDQAYETGLPDLDVPHRDLFMIIQCVRSMDDPTNQSGIREVIVELERLTREHFVREESLMISNEYPDLAKHVAEHAKLLMEIKTYENNAAFNAPQLSRVLFSWLMSDVLMQDRPLALHVLRLRADESRLVVARGHV